MSVCGTYVVGKGWNNTINVRETDEEGGCWGNGVCVVMKMNVPVSTFF